MNVFCILILYNLFYAYQTRLVSHNPFYNRIFHIAPYDGL
jgi:hypothetical protein